jgi:hypothetical protein
MIIAASFEQSFGYGYFTCSIVRHLISKNVDVQLVPLFGHHVAADLVPYCLPKLPRNIDVMVVSMPQLPTAPKATALFTMWEASEVPSCYASDLKKFKHLIVPTKWSADSMRPHHPRNIHFCPLGVRGNWTPLSFAPFTFTVVAADHQAPERKRVQAIVDTFSATFPVESDVKLLIKRNPECQKLNTFDNRIEIISNRVSRDTYETLIARTTVGIQLCAAEGWSLPVNEFMLAGKPVIAPLAGAIGDHVSPSAVFPIGYTMRKAPPNVYLGCGQVPHASVKDLAAQMRFAYENRFEVVRRGVAAYETSQKHTAHAMGENFHKLWQSLS